MPDAICACRAARGCSCCLNVGDGCGSCFACGCVVCLLALLLRLSLLFVSSGGVCAVWCAVDYVYTCISIGSAP
eukprot:6508462-Pyramimonas_sp.AAC.1